VSESSFATRVERRAPRRAVIGGYEEKEIMNRKHAFRAAFYADSRNSLGCGLSATPPMQGRRHILARSRFDWEQQRHFDGGNNASA
jgi:hypothetical protein